MNALEEEVIFLKAIVDLTDSAINSHLFAVVGSDPESNVLFHTSIEQKYFNVLLTDFLSMTDKAAPVTRHSYLSALRAIAAAPAFDVNDSVLMLRQSEASFTKWLETEVTVDIWLPSISQQVNLKLTRVTFLKMCGDLSKHNFLRSMRVADELRAILARSGVTVSSDESLLALDDFYQRFHDDILNYHSSTIAEFLNEIRWGIHEYLQPEFEKSIIYDDPATETPRRYHYTIPPAITSEFAKTCYWNLLNDVRRKPLVRRFGVTKWLKLRY